MPENDGVAEIEIVGPSDDSTSTEEADNMADLPEGVAAHYMGQQVQSANIAQNNFITVSKSQDYDYQENKRMVTLDEAIGAREVQSAVNPGGPAPRQV